MSTEAIPEASVPTADPSMVEAERGGQIGADEEEMAVETAVDDPIADEGTAAADGAAAAVATADEPPVDDELADSATPAADAAETPAEEPAEEEAQTASGADDQALQEEQVVKGEDEAAEAATPAPPLELPKAPKRAKPAFSYFLDDKFGSRPSREAGDAWKTLSDDEKRPYVEKHEADKERYARELEVQKEFFAAHPELVPPSAGGKDDDDDPATAVLPLAKVKRLMRKANLKPSTSIAKDAVFLVAKSSEAFLHLLTEQSAHAAVGHKRKKVTMGDFDGVLYGNRNADLLDFLHGDFPKGAYKADRQTPLKRAVSKPRKPKPAAGEGGDGDGDGDGEAGVANKENGSKRKKGAAAEAPVQSTNMHHFFGAKPAGAEGDEADVTTPSKMETGEGDDEDDEDDDEDEEEAADDDDDEQEEDNELLEDVPGEAGAAPAGGGTKKRRLAMVSDDDDSDAES